MFSNRLRLAALSAAVLMSVGTQAFSEEVRIRVTAESVSPANSTFLTPIWVGFHDGSFDTYNGNTPANSLPIPGSVAMERLCEDGNNGPITEDFATLILGGTDTTIPGPNGPIAPGEFATAEFVLESTDPINKYFSYASMILPSNDFCISNGNPFAHAIFDDNGEFIAQDFFVVGSETLDSGTEVNDEIPANTAFFGQAAPNTGVEENGVIGTLGSDLINISGFLPVGSGGILDDERFAAGDFSVAGYPFVKFSFEVVEDIDNNLLSAVLDGGQEVPPVNTPSVGDAEFIISDDGQSVDYVINLRANENANAGITRVTMAHLHLAPAGTNGPVIVNLLAGINTQNLIAVSQLSGTLTAADLVGPLAGASFSTLASELNNGNVYINIHTRRNPSGEIRGQVFPEQ